MPVVEVRCCAKVATETAKTNFQDPSISTSQEEEEEEANCHGWPGGILRVLWKPYCAVGVFIWVFEIVQLCEGVSLDHA